MLPPLNNLATASTKVRAVQLDFFAGDFVTTSHKSLFSGDLEQTVE